MTRMTTTGPGYHRASAAVMFGGVTALTLGFALSTAATASADQTVQNTYAVKGSETVNVAVRCPDNMYLVMSDYSSSARLVPYGVEVIESGTAVGVTMTGVDQQQGPVVAIAPAARPLALGQAPGRLPDCSDADRPLPP